MASRPQSARIHSARLCQRPFGPRHLSTHERLGMSNEQQLLHTIILAGQGSGWLIRRWMSSYGLWVGSAGLPFSQSDRSIVLGILFPSRRRCHPLHLNPSAFENLSQAAQDEAETDLAEPIEQRSPYSIQGMVLAGRNAQGRIWRRRGSSEDPADATCPLLSARGSGPVAERRFGHGDDRSDAGSCNSKPFVIACTGEEGPSRDFGFSLWLDLKQSRPMTTLRSPAPPNWLPAWAFRAASSATTHRRSTALSSTASLNSRVSMTASRCTPRRKAPRRTMVR